MSPADEGVEHRPTAQLGCRIGVFACNEKLAEIFLRRVQWHRDVLIIAMQRVGGRFRFELAKSAGGKLQAAGYDELHVLIEASDSAAELDLFLPCAGIVHAHFVGRNASPVPSGVRSYAWRSLEEAASFWARLYLSTEHASLAVNRNDELSWIADGLVGVGEHVWSVSTKGALAALHERIDESCWRGIQRSIVVVEAPVGWRIRSLEKVRSALYAPTGAEPEILVLLSPHFVGCSLSWLCFIGAGELVGQMAAR